MTYEITPAHFGITKRLQWVLALGTLACIILPMFIWLLIWPSPAWSWRELIPVFVTWAALEILWYFQTHYSLAVDDNSVHVAGGRVIRKGHLRYVREINSRPWRGGPRLVLSEHALIWARLLGRIIVIPKGLPEYEQIKEKVFAWRVKSADPVT
ncbi:MAG TPA: hypothetical protein VIY68_17545 [Steroidobacteraceae bacterium]